MRILAARQLASIDATVYWWEIGDVRGACEIGDNISKNLQVFERQSFIIEMVEVMARRAYMERPEFIKAFEDAWAL